MWICQRSGVRQQRFAMVCRRRQAPHLHQRPYRLPLQALQRATELALLVPDHVRTEVAIGSLAVARLAEGLGQVEDERDGEDVVLPCQGDQRPARLLLYIRRVDDREQALS